VNLQQLVFARLYRRTPSVEALPWHREQPPALLEQAIERRGAPGRALDLGCGEGVYAVHLAQQGYEVVAADFVPAALAATGPHAGRRLLVHAARRVTAARARRRARDPGPWWRHPPGRFADTREGDLPPPPGGRVSPAAAVASLLFAAVAARLAWRAFLEEY